MGIPMWASSDRLIMSRCAPQESSVDESSSCSMVSKMFRGMLKEGSGLPLAPHFVYISDDL